MLLISPSPDNCLSNPDSLAVAATPSDSNLLEIPRKALKNVQAMVSELVSSMRDPSNADVQRVRQLCNQKLLPETRENWQPAVASARACINAQIEGYAASEALIKLLVLYPLNNSAIASLKAFKHPSKWFRHCFVVIVYEG